MRRRLRRDEVKRRNKKIIITSLLILCLLSVGYGAFQTTLNINVTGRVNKCTVGRVWNIDYTGDIKEIVIPCDGTYKLETWGAQGGTGEFWTNSYMGGYGGYSEGMIDIERGRRLFIGVGGKGTSANISGSAKGGYNGGGEVLQRTSDSSANRMSGSGGGLSHIAFNSGILTELENEKSGVILVAGGGGGGKSYGSNNYSGIGGHGGGYIGGNGIPNNQKVYGYGTGGTQTSGGDAIVIEKSYGKTSGKFGQGAIVNYPYESYYLSGPGGGGGWYGGGSIEHGPAGGGSGYIGHLSLTKKAMYCYNCEESLDLTKPEIFTVSTTGDTNYKDILNCPDGYSENPISKCAKKGNGFARITLISKK